MWSTETTKFNHFGCIDRSISHQSVQQKLLVSVQWKTEKRITILRVAALQLRRKFVFIITISVIRSIPHDRGAQLWDCISHWRIEVSCSWAEEMNFNYPITGSCQLQFGVRKRTACRLETRFAISKCFVLGYCYPLATGIVTVTQRTLRDKTLKTGLERTSTPSSAMDTTQS